MGKKGKFEEDASFEILKLWKSNIENTNKEFTDKGILH